MKSCGPLVLLLACACVTPGSPRADAVALVTRFVEAANAHDYDALDGLLASDFVRRSPATPDVVVRSPDDMKAFLRADAESFPDGRVTLGLLVVEGPAVAFQGVYTGTHLGPMGPWPATGRALELPVSGRFRVADGRIAELYILWDNLDALRQLGLLEQLTAAGSGTAEGRKALARVWFDEVINRRDLDAIDLHYAEDYVHHGPGGAELRGRAAARQLAAAILAASSDRVATVEQQVVEGDLVVTRFISRGTNDGPFRGAPPTGAEWITEGICISRVEAGRIAEDWELVEHSGP